MRRLDLHPKKKLRGNRRRLQAFNSYLERVSQYQFSPRSPEELYDNWKIPAFQKALHARPKLANCWLKTWVAHGITWLEHQDSQYVSCLVLSLPDAFSSEYCTFFDLDYFRRFINRQNEWQTWDRVDSPRPPCFMQGFDLSRYTLLEFNETVRDDEFDYTYRGKEYLLCHHLSAGVI